MIRLPDIPTVQPSPINAPGIRLDAAAAPSAALGNLARSIAETGADFHGIAMHVQERENARAISQQRQQIAAAMADIDSKLDKDPNPATRLDRARELLSAEKLRLEGLDPESLPPAVRDEALSYYASAADGFFIEQNKKAALLADKRASLALDNELEAARAHRNRDAFATALQTAQKAGIILPEQETKALRDWDRKDAFDRAREAIAADPIEAEKQLSDPEFLKKNPLIEWDDRDRLQREAEQQANRTRSDFMNDLIISDQMPNEDELAALEEGGWITKETRARMLVNLRNGPAAFDPALYEEAYTQVVEYDPAKDPSGRTEAQLRSWLASQALPKESISALNQRLTDRLNPEISGKPIAQHEKDFASKILTDFHRGDFGKYRFPVDDDNNPDTKPKFPINAAEYDKAHKVRGQFAEQWRAELKRLPADASFDQVQKSYDALKKSFKDRTPAPALNIGGTVPALPFDPDKTYQSATPRQQFGGQPLQPAGGVYGNAAATVFGGPNDPADNGLSAFGGKTGAGGKEGTAIPQKLLAAKFPGKDKAWIAENVRTVVRAPNGTMKVLPVVDLGTAEWVWQKNGRPTLDLTEGAAKEMGGQPVYQGGKLTGLKGLDNLQFAVVSVDAGKPLAGLSWQDAKAAWFKTNKPGSMQAADLSLIALREAWNMANAGALNTGELEAYNVIQ